MSDEQAKKKESELAKEKESEDTKKTEEEKVAEKKKTQIWSLTLAIDPETWEFEMFMNENVKKQSQVDMLLNCATKQIGLTSQARVIGEMVVRLMAAKSKKGFFKGRS